MYLELQKEYSVAFLYFCASHWRKGGSGYPFEQGWSSKFSWTLARAVAGRRAAKYFILVILPPPFPFIIMQATFSSLDDSVIRLCQHCLCEKLMFLRKVLCVLA